MDEYLIYLNKIDRIDLNMDENLAAPSDGRNLKLIMPVR